MRRFSRLLDDRICRGVSRITGGTSLQSLDYATGTFARASVGRYLTGAVGDNAYASAIADAIRQENRGDGAGSLYLFEGSRTNELRYSRAPNSWSTKDAGITRNAGAANGVASGTIDTWTYASGAAKNHYDNPGGTFGDTNQRTISFFGRYTSNGDLTQYKAYASIGAGLLVSLTGMTGSWARYQASGASTSAWAKGQWLRTETNATAYTVAFDLFQLEQGRFPTSPIDTTTGSATRSADSLTWASAPSWLLSSNAKFSQVSTLMSSAQTTSGDEFWLVSFGGSSNGIRIRNNAGTIRVEAVSSGSVVASSGSLTLTAHGLLGEVQWNPAAGIVSVNGTPGSAGTPWTWSAAALRIGGVHGGSSEAYCRLGSLTSA